METKEYYKNRRNDIVEMIWKGLTYKSIANKYGISKQRVSQFAKRNNIPRWKVNRKKYKKLVNRIHKYLENNPLKDNNNSYAYCSDIKTKFNLTTNRLQNLKRYGLKFMVSDVLKDRNNKIIDDYFNKKLTAKNIITKNYGPLTLYSIYSICYSGNRHHKFRTKKNLKNKYFEKKEIFDLISDLKDKYKMSYKEITDYMNNKKYKTVYGKDFKIGSVIYKYNKAKKNLKSLI